MLPEALGQRAELSIPLRGQEGPTSELISCPARELGGGAEPCPVSPDPPPVMTPSCLSGTALPSGPTGGQGHVGNSPNALILFVTGPIRW